MKLAEPGYSLLELLIAITLALFLSAGVTSLFIHTKKTYQLAQHLNRIQTGARVAFNFLSHDICMAGLIGCVRLVDFSPLHSELTLDTSLVVWHDGRSTSTLAFPHLLNYRQDSDIIFIQGINPHVVSVKFAKDNRITLASLARFKPNDILLISDCQHAEAVRWGYANLRYTYQQDSEIGFLNKVVYYIADTGRRNEMNEPIYALYRRDFNQSFKKPTELIEGIEKMSIRLGVRNKGDGRLDYVTANHVKNWSDVRSAEISLLFSEGQLRREWKHIIALREREAYD